MNNVISHIRRLYLIRGQLKNFTTISTANTFNTKLKFRFNTGAMKIPHFARRETGGEDALEIHEGMICVADGVGRWADSGVDPRIHSNELARNVKKYFLEEGLVSYNDPVRFFVKACNNTKAVGSSTCCFLVLDIEKNYIHSVNIGNSGYMVLRPIINKEKDALNAFDLQLVYKSEEQTHGFNNPYQVGTDGDNPESAVKMVHDFQENDIIVLATDGLWDNLYESQIISVIKPYLKKSNVLNAPEIVALMIAKTAEEFSLNYSYKSPFATRSNGIYIGGKADDITVIVSQIINNV